MARSIWKGSLSFGLVNIPVGLYSAESRPDINLRMLDSRNNSRVRYERVNEATGEEVPWDQIVRGYEYDEDKYVLLSDEEMENVKLDVTKSVEIEDFVEEAEIEAVYFDKPYFLVPDKKFKPAFKSYALLRETLRRTGKVGIARVVIRTREYLSAVMVRGDILMLNLLRFSQELRDAAQFDLPDNDLKSLRISEKELKMADQLVETMTGDWEPEKYEDTYRAALMDWIEKKIDEGEFGVAPDVPEEEEGKAEGKVVDLMEYLKKSVEEAKSKDGGKGKASAKKTAKKKSARKTPAKKAQKKRA